MSVMYLLQCERLTSICILRLRKSQSLPKSGSLNRSLRNLSVTLARYRQSLTMKPVMKGRHMQRPSKEHTNSAWTRNCLFRSHATKPQSNYGAGLAPCQGSISLQGALNLQESRVSCRKETVPSKSPHCYFRLQFLIRVASMLANMIHAGKAVVRVARKLVIRLFDSSYLA